VRRLFAANQANEERCNSDDPLKWFDNANREHFGRAATATVDWHSEIDKAYAACQQGAECNTAARASIFPSKTSTDCNEHMGQDDEEVAKKSLGITVT
jgi:hypothetical protein